METPKFDVIKAMEERHSVRTYDASRSVGDAALTEIRDFAANVVNPFGVNDIQMPVIRKEMGGEKQRLGTYGAVSGANVYVGLATHDTFNGYLAGGYAFELLILYITSLGLGTVWLGATLNRSGFAEAMKVPGNLVLPAISPIGYAAPRRFTERMVRKFAKSDTRKPWEQLFFDGTPLVPLTPEAAGAFAKALEMVRIAPSATNTQPWRVIKVADRFHFYADYRDNASRNEQNFRHIDLGIGICHFDLACRALGLAPTIDRDSAPNIEVPPTWHYIATVYAKS